MGKQKIVFVTGGSRGIGKAIIEELIKTDMQIIAGYYQSEDQILELKETLQNKYHQGIDFVKGDLSTEEGVNQIITYIDEHYGTIDVLINNAGIAIDTTIEDKKAIDFKRIVNVNLLAPFLLMQHYGKKMYDQKQGKIINIASTNGIDTLYPESMDYDASKAGLISLTKNFARAYAPYVQVNAIAPGWINTEMNALLSEEFKKEETSKILLGRFGEPEEIAKVVRFLISDDANYINSTVIRVDGGNQ